MCFNLGCLLTGSIAPLSFVTSWKDNHCVEYKLKWFFSRFSSFYTISPWHKFTGFQRKAVFLLQWLWGRRRQQEKIQNQDQASGFGQRQVCPSIYGWAQSLCGGSGPLPVSGENCWSGPSSWHQPSALTTVAIFLLSDPVSPTTVHVAEEKSGEPVNPVHTQNTSRGCMTWDDVHIHI